MKGVRIDPYLTLGIIFYNLSQSAVWNFIRLQIYDMQGSFTEIMLISSIPSFFGFVLSKFWGDLSDSLGSRKIPILVGMIASTLIIPFFLLYTTVQDLLIIYTVMSFVSVIANPALNAAISETASFENRGKQIGIYMTFLSLGWTAGTMMGGYVVEVWGYNEMYLFSFITGLLAVVPMFFYRDQINVKRKKEIDLRGILKTTFDFDVGSPKAKFLVAAVFIHVFATSLFYNIYTLIFYELVERNAFFYGLINGAAGLGSIIVPKFYGDAVDKIGRKKMYIVTSLIYVPYFLTLANIRDVILVTILWFIPIWPGVQISVTAIATDIASGDKVARAQGVVQAVSSIARILGPLLGCVSADMLGAQVSMNNLTIILDVAAVAPLLAVYFASKL